MTADSDSRIRRRVIVYITMTLVLLLTYFFVQRASWHSSDQVHTVLEALATMLGLFMSFVALVRYYSHRSGAYLFLSAAFLGTTLLDGYHTLISSAFVLHRLLPPEAMFPSPSDTLSAWSWFAARLLLAVLLWRSTLAGDSLRAPERKGARDRHVFLAVGLCVLIAFFVLAFVPLPPYWVQVGTLTRPAELVPAAFFSLALVGALRRRGWMRDDFEHWLVIGLILSTLTHVPYFVHAGTPYDGLFDVAHILKIASYGAVLTGLVLSMHGLFRQADESGREMARANEALRAALQSFQSLAESATDAIVTADSRGRVVFWNDAAEAIFGYGDAEIVGRPLSVLMLQNRGADPQQGLDEIQNGGLSQLVGRTAELSGVAKDGREFPIELSMSTLSTAEGQLYLAIIRDITWRHRAQKEQLEASQRLTERQEASRLHLAQELHDGPLQDLCGIHLRLGGLATKSPTSWDPSAMAGLQLNVQECIDRIRRICTDLRPPALAPFGLEVAIRSHAASFRKAHPDLQVDLDLASDKQRLAERTRLALYRIYQQALDNLVRHAEAHRVWVGLSLTPDDVTLSIRDDGVGFNVPVGWLSLARKGHLGLLGASERADSVGGSLVVESTPGEGTLVRVTAPLSPPSEMADAGAEEVS